MPVRNQFNNDEDFLKALRDYFAAKAMVGELSSQGVEFSWAPEALADRCYMIADAMLKAKE